MFVLIVNVDISVFICTWLTFCYDYSLNFHEHLYLLVERKTSQPITFNDDSVLLTYTTLWKLFWIESYLDFISLTRSRSNSCCSAERNGLKSASNTCRDSISWAWHAITNDCINKKRSSLKKFTEKNDKEFRTHFTIDGKQNQTTTKESTLL